jgi:hypothetical protein
MKLNHIPEILRTLFVAVVVCVLGGKTAFAQATRTWVSGVGDDANPCSRTAPCKTFAGAISKTAVGGEIDAIDPGGFGSVTITKSITIDGDGTFASILAAGTNGIIINAGVNDVVNLRNLSINGAGTGLNGIRIIAGGQLNIENCVIFNFTQKGIDIEPSGACRVNIKNTIVRLCSNATTGGAVFVAPGVAGSVALNISKCHLFACRFGVSTEGAVESILDDCVISGNLEQGVNVSAGATSNINNCVITDNGTAGVVSGLNSTVHISNNTISLNNRGIRLLNNGAVISFGNNRIKDNTIDGAPTSTVSGQ